MMFIAAGWIVILLSLGGFALDRTLNGLVQRNFDDQLSYMLNAMVASAEIDQYGEIYFNRPLGDQRFLEPNSGLYWQITGKGHEDFPTPRIPTTSRTPTIRASLPPNRCG